MTPTVGRIVHYYHDSGFPPWAAIITLVAGGLHAHREEDYRVNLYLFLPGPLVEASVVKTGVHFSPTPRSGHWTWPSYEGRM